MPSAQHVMLAIHCKRTDNVELKNPILAYIREVYSDRDADEALDDLVSIQNQRNNIVTAQSGSTGASKEALVRYLKCLTAIETRFPISQERGHVKLSFPWYDAFRPSKKTAQPNIHFEKAAVLFNIAAVVSQQALQVERGTSDGVKQAAQLFQEAAGMYALLKEAEASKVDAPRPADLTPECCSMLERLMLAQAQECVYHKAVLDRKSSPGVLARLAKHAGVMYSEVGGMFNAPSLASHFERSWVSHTQMKAALYDVIALVEMGRQYNADTKISLEVATLQEAFTRFQAAKKLAKAVSNEMSDSLKGFEETLTLSLTKAQKDNNTVYLERVPPFADVPAITGAPLAKAIPPQGLLEGPGDQLFASLIPESSTKALSKYTDQVDALTRDLLDKLAGATDAARLALSQAELPDLLDSLDGRSTAAVPTALLHDVEEVQNIGGMAHLQSLLVEIGELRRQVEADLGASQAALDEEAAADGAARGRYADKWKVPQSATLAKALADKLAAYRTTLSQAGDSDARVMSQLQDSRPAFEALTVEAAAGAMPRLQAPLVPLGEDPATVVARLRRNLDALNTLSSERAGLEEAVKDAKRKDNILPQLMSAPPGSLDALFERELKKYDALRADVARNVARNDELLAALTRDAQAFRTVFEVSAWRAACDAASAGLKGALKSYRGVLDHLSEGLRFYSSLQDAVAKHKTQCSDFAYTRALQRDELQQDLDRAAREDREAKAAAAMSALHVHPGHAPGPAYPPHPQQTPHAAPPPPGPVPPAYMTYGAPPPAAGGPPPPQYPPPGYGAAPVQQPYHGSYASAPPPHHQPPPQGYGGYPPPQQHQQQQQQQQPPAYGGYQQPAAPNPYGQYGQQQYGAPAPGGHPTYPTYPPQ